MGYWVGTGSLFFALNRGYGVQTRMLRSTLVVATALTIFISLAEEPLA